MIITTKTYKLIANLLVFLSILFLLVYLYKSEQFVWLHIHNYFYFSASLFLIIVGYLIESFALKEFLKKDNITISLNDTITATGRYIFTKYIPGKVGMIFGKTAFLKEKTSRSGNIVLQAIFSFQLIVILAAAFSSIFPLYSFVTNVSSNFLLPTICIILLLVLISIKKVQLFFIHWLEKVFRKNEFQKIPAEALYTSLFLLVVNFCAWALGFFLFVKSLGVDFPIIGGFLFPLAAFIGVIVLIAPGGIGVREGVIVAGFIYFGISKDIAISISAFSRIWFLLGELIIFIMSFLLNKINKS